MNLDEIRKMQSGPARIKAVKAYVDAGEERLAEARKLRDDDVRRLLKKYGPSEVARLSELSLSTVKLIKGRP